ncbi:MAG: right-handed parallel beta-helix repeat-containing protein [Nitrososphaeraceae archaeon]
MPYQAPAAFAYSVLILLTIFLILQPILGNSAYASISLSSEIPESSLSSCIIYDPEENMIAITCRSANLSDIYAIVGDQNVLLKESDVSVGVTSGNFDGNYDNVWQLNSGISIAQNARLYINSTDTSWLKILADGESAHPILISGSLNMDSVKVTSWNPNTNNYATSQDSDRNGQSVSIGTPRPYIVVNDDATGTTDITNSELAYLGYEAGYGEGRTGLRYEAGDGSIIRGNEIYNLYFGLYTRGVGGMTIENNHIHDNIHYGLDPHTGTHDMMIRNNTVHDNGSTGVICSLDCYNISIENNKVYNNTKSGIMFSRNMFDSIARNNIISNEDNGIVISESHNNEVYNNIVSASGTGIDIDEDSYDNVVYNNTMMNIPEPSEALYLRDGASQQNTLYSNIIINEGGQEISLDSNN